MKIHSPMAMSPHSTYRNQFKGIITPQQITMASIRFEGEKQRHNEASGQSDGKGLFGTLWHWTRSALSGVFSLLTAPFRWLGKLFNWGNKTKTDHSSESKDPTEVGNILRRGRTKRNNGSQGKTAADRPDSPASLNHPTSTFAEPQDDSTSTTTTVPKKKFRPSHTEAPSVKIKPHSIKSDSSTTLIHTGLALSPHQTVTINDKMVHFSLPELEKVFNILAFEDNNDFTPTEAHQAAVLTLKLLEIVSQGQQTKRFRSGEQVLNTGLTFETLKTQLGSLATVSAENIPRQRRFMHWLVKDVIRPNQETLDDLAQTLDLQSQQLNAPKDKRADATICVQGPSESRQILFFKAPHLAKVFQTVAGVRKDSALFKTSFTQDQIHQAVATTLKFLQQTNGKLLERSLANLFEVDPISEDQLLKPLGFRSESLFQMLTNLKRDPSSAEFNPDAARWFLQSMLDLTSS